MNPKKLTLEQYRDLLKESKAQIQEWDKTQVIQLAYVGAQATARASVLDGKHGIVVTYVGAEASGTIEVTENSIILCAPALTPVYTLDLTAAANDTITELVAVIDAYADWTCTKHADMVGTELSKNMLIVAAADCKSGAYTTHMDRYLFIEAPNATPDTNVGPGGKVFLRDLAYDTLAELVAFLDGLADYTCALGTQFDGTDLSSNLAAVVATSIKTALWLAGDTNLQLKITVPAVVLDKSLKITKILGSSTFNGGTSFFRVYDGANLKWSEAAGATTVEKVSTMPGLTITPGNQAVIKILNSSVMTAGYLTIGYDEKEQGPYTS
jgi:hypothetical protein